MLSATPLRKHSNTNQHGSLFILLFDCLYESFFSIQIPEAFNKILYRASSCSFANNYEKLYHREVTKRPLDYRLHVKSREEQAGNYRRAIGAKLLSPICALFQKGLSK